VLTTPTIKTYHVMKCSYRKPQTWTDIFVQPKQQKCGGMDWIELAQDRERGWACVNAVMNLRVP
jgi:hypothetical protein